MNINLKIAVISFIGIFLAGCTWLAISLVGIKFGIKMFSNNVIGTIVIENCILVSQYFVIKKYNNDRFSFDFIDMSLKKNSFKKLFIGVSIGIILCIIWILILSVLKSIKFKGIGFMLYPASNVIINVISIFVISAFAGFCEEIAFRGVILNQLMQFKGSVFALIISSLIFTMYHIQYYHQPYILFYVFTAGILYGYLYIITGSLYLSIGLHFALDFFPSISSNI